MFKTSMFDCDMFSLPRIEFYKLMQQAGFDSVMIGWRDDDRIEKLEKARNAGLLIENIHAPTYNSDNIWLDNLNGEDYMECLLTCIEDCKKYNIPTMVVHISNIVCPVRTVKYDRKWRWVDGHSRAFTYEGAVGI